MHIEHVAILRFSRPLAFKGGEWGGLGLRYLTQIRPPMSEQLLVRLVSHLLIYVDEIWRGFHCTSTGVFSDFIFILDSVGIGGNLAAIVGNEMSWC